MANKTELMALLAERHFLTPRHAVVLPAVIENAAQKVSMTADLLLLECLSNVEAGAYIASVCRKVAIIAEVSDEL